MGGKISRYDQYSYETVIIASAWNTGFSYVTVLPESRTRKQTSLIKFVDECHGINYHNRVIN